MLVYANIQKEPFIFVTICGGYHVVKCAHNKHVHVLEGHLVGLMPFHKTVIKWCNLQKHQTSILSCL